jgi:hypothetical protein
VNIEAIKFAYPDQTGDTMSRNFEASGNAFNACKILLRLSQTVAMQADQEDVTLISLLL